MLTLEQTIERWRANQTLFHFDPMITGSLDLPASTKEFLIDVGMPISERGYFYVPKVYPQLPALKDLERDREIATECRDYRVFGSNPGLNIILAYHCLEVPSGRVCGVLRRPLRPVLIPSFFNGSIIQLVRFVLTFDEYEEWLDQQLDKQGVPEFDLGLLDQELVMDHVKGVIEELRQIDPDALAEVDHVLKGGAYFSEDGFPDYAWTQPIRRLAETGYWD